MANFVYIKDCARRALVSLKKTYYGSKYSGAPVPDDSIAFTCNVCSLHQVAPKSLLTREARSCKACASNVRARSIIYLLSMALFNRAIPLADFPKRMDVKGIGLSDWPGYAGALHKKLWYVNTFLNARPSLDITKDPGQRAGLLDFLIASDVFEHVMPPIGRAFENARKYLKPGGALIMTVPYAPEGPIVEFFPNLYDYRIEKRGAKLVLVNTRQDGGVEEFTDIVMHGGDGLTLEMRQFSEHGVLQSLKDAGFGDVTFLKEEAREFGILFPEGHSYPILARAPEK